MRAISAFLLVTVFFSACSTNNVTVDDSLGRFFDSAGVKGDFGMFDNGQGSFTIYNLTRFRDSGYLPGGTFDVVQSLIAIQSGLLKDENEVREAFRSTADTGVFGRLSLRIGHDSMRKWIDSLHYGNRDMSGPLDSFWRNDRLRITSDEQLGLIKKLYFGQLPFFRRSQELVRKMMMSEENSNYKLVYKTGQGVTAEGHSIGWMLGWVEENKHPYFFVLNMESASPGQDMSPIGLQLVKHILQPMGFFEGKK